MSELFGYIRICKSEMKIKEYDTYKAIYCSLCRKLGKSYGFFSRLTLSYDFTFLALLYMSMSEKCFGFERKRCAFNPMKKCNYCKDDYFLEMPTAAAMIMLYYKINDNILDEKGIKKLGNILIKPIFGRARAKAVLAYPVLEDIIKEYISEQNKLEKAGCKELDRAADPTAKAMAAVLSLCSEEKTQKRILERLGYCIGRYIYLLDAACDLPKDIEKGSYNVLAFNSDGNPSEYAKQRITPQLFICINEAGKAFELLDIKKFKSILGNIVYLGLEETLTKELSK